MRACRPIASSRPPLKSPFIYTVGAVTLYMVVALGLALLCKRNLPGVGIVRMAIFLPSLIPAFAMALVWGLVFNQGFGLVNSFLKSVGLPQQGWFQSSSQALPLAITITLWTIGAAFIVFLAGLQSIPEDLYEAIVVDGATAWGRFWHVTLPMLSPVILFNLVIGVIASFQVFDLDWALTSGGPGTRHCSTSTRSGETPSRIFRSGYASALAWVLFLIIIAVTALIFRTARYWVHYEGQP